MSKRLHPYSIGVAMSGLFERLWTLDIRNETSVDPYKPRPRSKGEKARNRKSRRG